MTRARKLALTAAVFAAAILPIAAATSASAAVNGRSAQVAPQSVAGNGAHGTTASGLAGHAIQPFASVHGCAVIAGDGNTAAVACVDVVDLGVVNGLPSEYFQVEGYCQSVANPSVDLQCGDISVSYSGWEDTNEVVSATGHCGHSAPACPAGRYVTHTSIQTACGPNVWTLIQSVRFQLPGSDKVVSATNLGSAFDDIAC